MADSTKKSSVPTWRFISPETFELSLRRLMQPSAEDKMREALDLVIQQIEASKHGPQAEARAQFHEAERLRKKREKLKRRIEKLSEIKRMALGPLLFSLLFGFIVWIVILGVSGAGAYVAGSSIQEALARDKAGIEERSNTGLTIEEVNSNVHSGQIIGLPPQDEEGNFLKSPEDEYLEPETLAEITEWSTEPDSCEQTLEQVTYEAKLLGCEAAGYMSLVKVGDPTVTMKCLWLQLGDETGASSDASASQQKDFGKNARFVSDIPHEDTKVRYWVQDPTNSWDETMMLFCQAFGTQDDRIIKTMASSVGQIGVRTDAAAYFAGGVFTWLEADKSYAPSRVWKGQGPSD